MFLEEETGGVLGGHVPFAPREPSVHKLHLGHSPSAPTSGGLGGGVQRTSHITLSQVVMVPRWGLARDC